MPKDMPADMKIEAVAGKPVELPSGDFIANADMTRSGMDLHLTGPDGHTIVVEGYFAQQTPPDLVTHDGARLTPAMVSAFVPPEHAGQYASSGQIASDASPAGKITQVVGDAQIVHADGTKTPAIVGSPVYQGDVIETSKTGAVNIQFADNTTFAISESARMSVDQFVYHSADHSGSTFFSMLQGVFVYTSGLIGKTDPGAVNIETPVGSIGIRGTVVAGHILPAGQNSQITIVDGAITLTNGTGTQDLNNTLATVSVSGYQSPITSLPMDAATFNNTYSAISSVAGNELSHFTGMAVPAPAAEHAPAATAPVPAGSNGETAPATATPAAHSPAAAPVTAPAPATPTGSAAPAPATTDSGTTQAANTAPAPATTTAPATAAPPPPATTTAETTTAPPPPPSTASTFNSGSGTSNFGTGSGTTTFAAPPPTGGNAGTTAAAPPPPTTNTPPSTNTTTMTIAPPPIVFSLHAVDPTNGTDVLISSPITYLLTFNEPLSAMPTTASFSNHGSATVAVQSVVATSTPNQYAVTVEAMTFGTVQMQAVSTTGVVITDINGDPLTNPTDSTVKTVVSYLGTGNDTYGISFTPTSLAIDGGTGYNHLYMTGSNTHLDLTNPSQFVRNFSEIDFQTSTGSNVTLNAQSIYNMTNGVTGAAVDTLNVMASPSAMHDFVNIVPSPAGGSLTLTAGIWGVSQALTYTGTAANGSTVTLHIAEYVNAGDSLSSSGSILVEDSTHMFSTTSYTMAGTTPGVPINVTASNELMIGVAGSSQNLGDGGNNQFSGDILIGNSSGHGNNIYVSNSGFQFIDGGAEATAGNTLVLGNPLGTSNVFNIDFTTLPNNVRNIDTIDLGTANVGTLGNSVKLNIQDVFNMTNTADGNTLYITDGGRVNLTGVAAVTVVANSTSSSGTFGSGVMINGNTDEQFTGVYTDTGGVHHNVTLVVQGVTTNSAGAGIAVQQHPV